MLVAARFLFLFFLAVVITAMLSKVNERFWSRLKMPKLAAIRRVNKKINVLARIDSYTYTFAAMANKVNVRRLHVTDYRGGNKGIVLVDIDVRAGLCTIIYFLK